MSNITYEEVPYFVDGEKSAKAGLIVLQEWWGLNEQIKKKTTEFAHAVGALAIAPDLYRGKVTTKEDEANHEMSHLNWDQAYNDIRNAVKYLRSQGVQKVGIMGFCLGGALTLGSAIKVEGIDAASVFYGIPGDADPKNVHIPVQYHFGDKDATEGFADKKTAGKFKEGLKAAGKDTSEFHQYPEANHAFMNEEELAYPYKPEIAKVARDRTVAFFKKHLL
ncbi:dienelactone hydrolase [Powellomyces hirtus]|nr:dienelactone hydrolase [Powellomyces hirtus]